VVGPKSDYCFLDLCFEMKAKSCKILVFYNEVMGYTEAFFDSLSQHSELTVICWAGSKKLTPYRQKFNDRVNYISEQNITPFTPLLFPILRENWDLVIINGWTTKKYLILALYFRILGVPCVVTLDGQINPARSWLYLIARKTYCVKLFFSHAFVAGPRQVRYAKALGFKSSRISEGFLSADTRLYGGPVATAKTEKIFLYVGRLAKEKGLNKLLTAWCELPDRNGWSLHIVGGSEYEWSRLSEKFRRHESFGSIIFESFGEPTTIVSHFDQASCFILPSSYEPWGVVVHEAALRGCMLICTEAVGAVDQFLVDGENGFLIDDSTSSLIGAMIKVIHMSEEKRRVFCLASRERGLSINVDQNAALLAELVSRA
jgi:glycosyltransferase involved in cell wall biosynthesis